MIVTELGLDPDWSAAYTANSGQQDAVIRVQFNEQRTIHLPGICRSIAAPDRGRIALCRPAGQF